MTRARGARCRTALAIRHGARTPALALLTLALLVSAGCLAPAPAGVDAHASTSHHALLWNHPFPALAFDVYHAPGREPAPMALDALVEAARDVTGKRSVRLNGPTVINVASADAEHEWSDQERRELGIRLGHTPGVYGADGVARVPVFFLNGGSTDSQGDRAFGLESDGWLFVFPDRMRNGPDPARALPDPEFERHQRQTLVHEFGHALGLVDCGIPMVRPHEDPDDPCHSANPESVMSGNVILDPQRVLDDTWMPYAFDEDDLADIAAFRALDPTAAS